MMRLLKRSALALAVPAIRGLPLAAEAQSSVNPYLPMTTKPPGCASASKWDPTPNTHQRIDRVIHTAASPMRSTPTRKRPTSRSSVSASATRLWLAAVDCSTIAAFCCVVRSIWFTAVFT